jgi:N-acetylglucosamine kinase-like BadF-type ATPase
VKYVLGVDGGGTKTYACIVSSSGEILGEGSSGPSNYHDVGLQLTKANIALAIAQASHQAELTKIRFDAAFLGLASVVSETDRAVIRAIAEDLDLPTGERLGIDHDCRIALAGGLSGRPGIVQIVGTGASTYGRNAAGEEWRSGGWAHLLSDEGAGYWYGLNAMKAAVRAEDGRSKGTVLKQLVMERLELTSMNDIMHRLYVLGMSRAEIASLCPLLISAAEHGDEVALSLIDEGANHIAECVEAVARKLGFAPRSGFHPRSANSLPGSAGGSPAYEKITGNDNVCELALVGGLFNAGEIVVQPLRNAVQHRLPNCKVNLAELQPVLGACLLALDLINASTANNSQLFPGASPSSRLLNDRIDLAGVEAGRLPALPGIAAG